MKRFYTYCFVALFGVVISILSVSCEKKEDVTVSKSPTITQGIYGQVLERYGNWQPVYDPNDTLRGYRPIEREVYVYEYTKDQDFDKVYIYCEYPADKMPKPLVAKTKSDKNGFYQVQLTPGIYSVFFEENGNMYANGLDAYGGIMPVSVIKDSVLHIDLILNHGVD